jgi:uncharacterized protein YbbK (DUF523 family)
MHIHTSNRRFRIDLCPSLENGLWVVRQDIHIEGDKWEEVGEHQFGTEKEADAFIDRWIAKQKSKA